MRVVEIIPDLHVENFETAREFYAECLGLSTEEFNLGWVARYTSPEAGVSLQIVTHDAAAPADPVVTVKVDDVDAAYQEAQRRGYESSTRCRTNLGECAASLFAHRTATC